VLKLIVQEVKYFKELNWYIWERGEVHTRFRWKELRERDDLEDLRVDWRIILKHRYLQEVG